MAAAPDSAVKPPAAIKVPFHAYMHTCTHSDWLEQVPSEQGEGSRFFAQHHADGQLMRAARKKGCPDPRDNTY